MFQICFYVPASHVEKVKNAMFAKGAGQVGLYTHCAWQIEGEGQFMPLSGSQPFMGKTDQLERAKEYKVEMICREECLSAVIAAMKEAHPYEEPGYFIFSTREV